MVGVRMRNVNVVKLLHAFHELRGKQAAKIRGTSSSVDALKATIEQDVTLSQTQVVAAAAYALSASQGHKIDIFLSHVFLLSVC